MIAPHGGKLINRTADSPQAETELREASKGLRSLTLTGRELNDLALIGNGALSPFVGFMTRKDYDPVVSAMRLANGLPWSIPVVLAVDRDEAPTVGARAALYDGEGKLRGVIDVEDVSNTTSTTKPETCIAPRMKSIRASQRSTIVKTSSSADRCGCSRARPIRRAYRPPRRVPSSNAGVGRRS